ncbi:MAG: biotin--[acetyl-CoA-carboxylase] ligase, partial [Deltaproteobacteria bacterium]
NFLPSLDASMQEWIGTWAAGDGFARVREAWLKRSLPVGTALSVNSGQGMLKGTFAGLAADGALLITTASGVQETVSFGDVALVS